MSRGIDGCCEILLACDFVLHIGHAVLCNMAVNALPYPVIRYVSSNSMVYGSAYPKMVNEIIIVSHLCNTRVT